MTVEHPVHRGALAVWLVALGVYVLAVFHRSSLAVAGLQATERFGTTAAQLATFTMLQLLVYAAMQVPVGLLLDRFGALRVLTTGLATMTLAQTGFALATVYPVAVLARVGVGLGDAMVFICVLRLVNAWFPARRIPLVTQLTGVLGQSGAILAAVPMTWSLARLGWTPTYLAAAGLGVGLGVLLLLVVRDTPEQRRVSGPPLTLRGMRETLATVWSQPGTRLGFWTHFTTPFSANMLGLLWGYPFLVRSEGLSPTTAGLLLSVMVVVVMACGPLLAWLTTWRPWHRSSVVLAVTSVVVLVWTLVLAWPGPAPLPVLLLLVVVCGMAGPVSVIGFDFGRTSNPAERVGSATGVINQGGFIATLVLVVAIGAILDWRTPGSGSDYSPEAFTWAMSAQYPLWALGLVQVYRYRRRARALVLAAQAPAP
ncbi:MAG: MFS transporter [Nocardioides sp.]|nr:MFS transporter [Nocardioides sp.]